MRTFLAAMTLVLLAAAAYAGSLVRDDNGQAVQTAAYHGGKSAAVTVYSTVIDLRGDTAYSLYCGAGAYERYLPASDTAKSGYVRTPLPTSTWSGGAVNPSTPFLNISGCVGYIKRQ